jgi:nuclear transcription Y subunit beta
MRTLAMHCCRASDKCQRERRKTINGDDLLWAMTTLGFDEYVEPLKAYLAKFREAERKALAANALAAGKAAPAAADPC